MSYRVRRKDVVTFAGQAQLDWKEIPDPLKGYKIAGLCLLILAVLVGGFFLARPYLFKTSGGGSYGGGGGGGAVPPATTQPVDTVKSGIEGTNVDEVLKKMTEEENARSGRPKERKSRRSKKPKRRPRKPRRSRPIPPPQE